MSEKYRVRWRADLGKWVWTHNKIYWLKTCVDCGACHLSGPRAVRCSKCRRARNVLLNAGTGGAHAKIARAIRRGKLLPAHEFPCIDCGKPANVYDHRDYALALKVVPVCWSCNSRRGMAARISIPGATLQ